jgi:putative transposase
MKHSSKQTSFEKINWKHRYSHGGSLRQVRAGRHARPLSTKDPLHLVLKAHREVIGQGFRAQPRFILIHKVLKQYAKRFLIKIEQVSIQGDHIHLLIRTSKRSQFQSFFRVLSGQIAQRFVNEGLLTVTDTPAPALVQAQIPGSSSGPAPTAAAIVNRRMKLWKHRPFTRVVKGWKAYQTVKSYVRLNEKEACGEILYRKTRLRGLSEEEWRQVWS